MHNLLFVFNILFLSIKSRTYYYLDLLPFQNLFKLFKMAETGDEFIVDKILDKRSRNGKIEYYLSWKVHSQWKLNHVNQGRCTIYMYTP